LTVRDAVYLPSIGVSELTPIGLDTNHRIRPYTYPFDTDNKFLGFDVSFDTNWTNTELRVKFNDTLSIVTYNIYVMSSDSTPPSFRARLRNNAGLDVLQFVVNAENYGGAGYDDIQTYPYWWNYKRTFIVKDNITDEVQLWLICTEATTSATILKYSTLKIEGYYE
jgi:hypothetical protein